MSDEVITDVPGAAASDVTSDNAAGNTGEARETARKKWHKEGHVHLGAVIPEEKATSLKQVARLTNKNTTQAVEEAVDLYLEKYADLRQRAADLLS